MNVQYYLAKRYDQPIVLLSRYCCIKNNIIEVEFVYSYKQAIAFNDIDIARKVLNMLRKRHTNIYLIKEVSK